MKTRQVIETKQFCAEIHDLLKKRSLLQEDYESLKKQLAENPEAGALLIGTGGIRKIRLKSSSRGKSGGFRICYYYYISEEEIYLLFIFQKNEQENLTTEQKKNLKHLIDLIKKGK